MRVRGCPRYASGEREGAKLRKRKLGSGRVFLLWKVSRSTTRISHGPFPRCNHKHFTSDDPPPASSMFRARFQLDPRQARGVKFGSVGSPHIQHECSGLHALLAGSSVSDQKEAQAWSNYRRPIGCPQRFSDWLKFKKSTVVPNDQYDRRCRRVVINSGGRSGPNSLRSQPEFGPDSGRQCTTRSPQSLCATAYLEIHSRTS